jgi:hypothetical protein
MRNYMWPLVHALMLGHVFVASLEPLSAARPASLGVDEIYARSTAMYGRIKSLRVEYERSQSPDPSVPFGQGVKLVSHRSQYVFAMREEMRYRYERPLDTDDSGREPTLTVYNGERSAFAEFQELDLPAFQEFEGDALNISPYIVAVSPDRLDDTRLLDSYTWDFLKLPLGVGQRATYDEMYVYPHAFRPAASDVFRSRVASELESISGVDCHVLEIPGRLKVWVDTSRGCAWVRREEFSGPLETPYVTGRSQVDEFVEPEPGIWVPRRARLEIMSRPTEDKEFKERVAVRFDVDLKGIEINRVGPEQFRIPVKAGTSVIVKGGGIFRVSDDSANVMEPTALKLLSGEVESETGLQWTLTRQVAMGVTACAIVFLLLVALRQRRAS